MDTWHEAWTLGAVHAYLMNPLARVIDALDAEREKVRVAVEAITEAIEIFKVREFPADDIRSMGYILQEAIGQLKPEGDKE